MAGNGVVLGLDCGTTSTKVVIADSGGNLLGETERGYPLRAHAPGEATQDAEQVTDAAMRALAEAAGWCAENGHEVRAVSVCSAMHTVLGLDAAHRPVTRVLSWADSRATAVARRLRDEHGMRVQRATGTPLHPMAPVVKLAWLHEQPDTPAAAVWCSIKDFLLLRLTGQLLADYSSASGSGLLGIGDATSADWEDDCLRIAGVDRGMLPALVDPAELLELCASAASETGLDRGVRVVAGAGDGPLGNLGTGALDEGVAAVSLGTSGAIRTARRSGGVDPEGALFSYRLGQGWWVLGGAISNGGVAGQWVTELLEGTGTPSSEQIAELLEEAARVPAGAAGMLAMPMLLGERAPYWDAGPRGVLLGLRREHGRAELARAVVEGACQQLALVSEALVAQCGEPNQVRVTGGALRSPVWAQALTAALDMPVRQVSEAGGSGLGACLLGWTALGELDSLRQAAALVAPGERVLPDPVAAERMRAARPVLRRAYRALEAVFDDVAELTSRWEAGR